MGTQISWNTHRSAIWLEVRHYHELSDKTLINEWCSGKGKLMTKPALETGLNEDETQLVHTLGVVAKARMDLRE